mgnify:CR=1 FL=1
MRNGQWPEPVLVVCEGNGRVIVSSCAWACARTAQIHVTENFRARIEHLHYSQQRLSATKPQYEANIPSDTRRTLVSHLQKQKNILVSKLWTRLFVFQWFILC